MNNVGLNGCRTFDELVEKFAGSTIQQPRKKTDAFKNNPAYQKSQERKSAIQGSKEFTSPGTTPIDFAKKEYGDLGKLVSSQQKGKWQWYRITSRPDKDYFKPPPKKRTKDYRLWYDDVDSRVYSTIGYVHCGIEIPYDVRASLDSLELASYAAKDWELAQQGIQNEKPKSPLELIADAIPEFETLNLEI